MPIAKINGQSIAYDDTGGDGPALIFSHGFLMDRTMFEAQLDSFRGNYRCVVWDERGFGDTPVAGPFSYWDSADDAVALMDHLGIDRAVLLGGCVLWRDAAVGDGETVSGEFPAEDN